MAKSYKQWIAGGIKPKMHASTGLTSLNQVYTPPAEIPEHNEVHIVTYQVSEWGEWKVGQEGIFNDVGQSGEVRRSVEGKILKIKRGTLGILYAEVQYKNPPNPQYTRKGGETIKQEFPTTTVRLK